MIDSIDYDIPQCPIAPTLEIFGDQLTFLIIADLFQGAS
jgi:DNA-binding HxlR family transcriptional regulator